MVDYICSHCAEGFASNAKPGNIRHACLDGSYGVGKLDGLDSNLAPEAPEDVPEDVPEEDGVLAGDVELDEVELELGDVAIAYAPEEKPPEEPPTQKTKAARPSRKQDRVKVQTLVRAAYVAAGIIEVDPDEEAAILSELWSTSFNVRIDTGELVVNPTYYAALCGLITVAVMLRRNVGPIDLLSLFAPAPAKVQTELPTWGD